jgi:hypothetical protein
MSIFARIRSRVVPAAAVAAVALGVTASASEAAGSDHYFSGGLSAKRFYGSISAHTSPTYTQSTSDHYACPGLVQGIAGYFYSGATAIYLNAYHCGSGVQGYNPGQSGTWHGVVSNPNEVTADSFSDTHYSW